MANLITLLRLPLLFAVILLIYMEGPLRFLAPPLIAILFLMDWMDGLVARQRAEVSELGSILDIAIDRVVESLLWVVFADIDMVPVWAPLLVITRGFIGDTIRGYALSKGLTPFEMMESGIGHFLVSSRFMRGLYGIAKVTIFVTLSLVLALKPYVGEIPRGVESSMYWGVVLVVGLCVLRGLPVVIEGRRLFSYGGKSL